jgi:pimeloyl-ACP methyl ester carboxylesterase
MMMVESTFDTGDVILNYAEGPDNGPPLLLLHGATALWQHWQPVIPTVIQTWHVYAPDFRGNGLSGRVPRGYNVKDFTRDIVTFIREKLVVPVVILGHSLGAAVATQLSAEHGELVRAAVLEEPPLYLFENLEAWPSYPLYHAVFRAYLQLVTSGDALHEDRVASLLVDQLAVPPADAQRIASDLIRTDPDFLYQELIDCSMFDGFLADGLLDQIVCPVLLLHGDRARGSVLTMADVDRATVHLQQAIVHGFSDAGHLLHGPATAEEFLRVVTAFLDALP